MNRRNTMITSKKLSNERLEEIKKFPVVYTEDSPRLTADQIARCPEPDSERRNGKPGL
jgi:hypothetical protein